jgi:hypothetical protein
MLYIRISGKLYSWQADKQISNGWRSGDDHSLLCHSVILSSALKVLEGRKEGRTSNCNYS